MTPSLEQRQEHIKKSCKPNAYVQTPVADVQMHHVNAKDQTRTYNVSDKPKELSNSKYFLRLDPGKAEGSSPLLHLLLKF